MLENSRRGNWTFVPFQIFKIFGSRRRIPPPRANGEQGRTQVEGRGRPRITRIDAKVRGKTSIARPTTHSSRDSGGVIASIPWTESPNVVLSSQRSAAGDHWDRDDKASGSRPQRSHFAGCRMSTGTPNHSAATARSRKMQTRIRDPTRSSPYICAMLRLRSRTA